MNDTVLQVDALCKSYGALQATRNVSLDVKAGEIHALIGPNGAGKTTLIRQIYGSEASDSGNISLCGVSVTGLRVPQRIKLGIGRSFQISNVLMGFSVLENAIIAEQARIGKAFRFFRPAFSDQKLIDGGMKILSRVGMNNVPMFWLRILRMVSGDCLSLLLLCPVSRPCCCSTSLWPALAPDRST